MNDILKRIGQYGLVPVIKLDDIKDALPLADALMEGGLPVAEVTFRTETAEESIKLISSQRPDMLVGAGTVLTQNQLFRAIDAGAKFIISPGFDKKLVEMCIKTGVPIIPGVSTPSEIQAAADMELTVVKLFPAEALGGTAYIKAVSAAYKNIRFIPTGGVSQTNLKEYLALPQVFACGGSWMVKPEYFNDMETVKKLTREAMSVVLGFEMDHIGINCDSEDEAIRTAALLEKLFGFGIRNGNNSIFCSGTIELVKTNGRGCNGHIALKTNSIDRALCYLQAAGLTALPETAKYAANGKIKAVYLDMDICGFAIHLIEK